MEWLRIFSVFLLIIILSIPGLVVAYLVGSFLGLAWRGRLKNRKSYDQFLKDEGNTLKYLVSLLSHPKNIFSKKARDDFRIIVPTNRYTFSAIIFFLVLISLSFVAPIEGALSSIDSDFPLAMRLFLGLLMVLAAWFCHSLFPTPFRASPIQEFDSENAFSYFRNKLSENPERITFEEVLYIALLSQSSRNATQEGISLLGEFEARTNKVKSVFAKKVLEILSPDRSSTDRKKQVESEPQPIERHKNLLASPTDKEMSKLLEDKAFLGELEATVFDPDTYSKFFVITTVERATRSSLIYATALPLLEFLQDASKGGVWIAQFLTPLKRLQTSSDEAKINQLMDICDQAANNLIEFDDGAGPTEYERWRALVGYLLKEDPKGLSGFEVALLVSEGVRLKEKTSDLLKAVKKIEKKGSREAASLANKILPRLKELQETDTLQKRYQILSICRHEST